MPENINIDKTVFNKSQFVLAVDTKFSELFAQTSPITVDQFFVYYNDLFFEIPDAGNNSHGEIIQRSTEYLGVDPFETERNQLLNQIGDLESKVIELEAVDPEHPVFTNGTIIRNDTGIIYYMDKAQARQIVGNYDEIVKTVLKSQNSGLRSTPNDEINIFHHMVQITNEISDQIPKGTKFGINDFSGKNFLENESPSTVLLKKSIQQASEALKTGVVKKKIRSKKVKKKKKFITK